MNLVLEEAPAPAPVRRGGDAPAGCDRRRIIKVREEEYEVPCGSRYCGSCGVRWMGDQRVCAVAAAGEVGTAVALITITAPGREYFRAAGRRLGVRDREAMRRWNETARRRWRTLHLACSRPVRAWLGTQSSRPLLLMRSWEYQKRGALHLHLVLPFSTLEERRAVKLYVYNLWSCARDEGFGYVLGGDTAEVPSWERAPRVAPAEGASAARYVAKYVASTGAGKEGMIGVAQQTATRGSVLYISRTLGAVTGVTMGSLRARRRVATKYPGSGETTTRWGAACLVDAIQAGRPPLTPGAVLALRAACRAPGVVGWVDPEDGVLEPPTRAAVPLTAKEDRRPYAGPRRAVVAVLAPVLLGDPDPGPLGPTRTGLVAVEVIDL